MRGELNILAYAVTDGIGSSPLARGTLHGQPHWRRSSRFIPACAGNSDLQGPRNIVSPVHPRLRGELVAGHFSSNKKAGSSPLARGTHPRRFQGHLLRRFIPACAGNSIFLITLSISFRVHPRLRGELGGRHTHRTFGSGSSPLARGTRIVAVVKGAVFRFIPACAGNSLKQGIDHFSNFSKDFQLRK